MILHQHKPDVKMLLNIEDPTDTQKLNICRYRMMFENEGNTRPPIDLIERYIIEVLGRTVEDYYLESVEILKEVI